MPKSNPSDEQSVLIQKLKAACLDFDKASKKYLSAVKELGATMEGIAIAIRELSQGEESVAVRTRADSFCTAVDRHVSSAGARTNGSSKSKRSSIEAPPEPNTIEVSENYTFPSYMQDFTGEISKAVAELKETVRTTEKARDSHHKLMYKFEKKRSEVDKLETKLARKNQGVGNNPKFAKLVAARETMKGTVDDDAVRYRAAYDALLAKRTQTVRRVVEGLNLYSVKYLTSLARTMRS